MYQFMFETDSTRTCLLVLFQLQAADKENCLNEGTHDVLHDDIALFCKLADPQLFLTHQTSL